MRKYIIIILLIILVSGCWSYRSLKLETKNPTEYIFKVNSSLLKKALINSFPYNFYKGLDLIYHPKDTFNIKYHDIKEYKMIKLPGNHSKDIFFFNFHDTVRLNDNRIFLYNEDAWVLSSEVYYRHHRKLRYYASFLIIIDSLDSIHTKVKIKTIEPRIVVGYGLLPSIPHFVRLEKTKPVPPSTIEEYELLRYIGSKIGVDSMPPVVYPKGHEKLLPAKSPF